ncbi:unnamed protein product [Symbiodinium necroappetens]|uniref:Uncharacterized protein n=1 Tax=Symbiodinium necroappetens TaxID=1628268 RepID=A0A813AG57_9DINO|nr:unnamed protein product [Symbiodinium necroappetens]|mmetsp:Transcript_55767/g.133433  ORF Transcript_55767/g.133433 Transcript_55767/m.133433 type:complete len:165 (+) Transcript_55767:44-538(+)
MGLFNGLWLGSCLVLASCSVNAIIWDGTCSGESNLAREVASCFSWKALGENVHIKVLAFNATVKEGKMQLRGTGVSETECEIQFSQEAQAINLRQACLPSGVSSVTMKYCSDQDAFLLQAMVAGMSTDVFLAKGTCSAETSLAQSIIRRDRDRPVQHHRFDSPP